MRGWMTAAAAMLLIGAAPAGRGDPPLPDWMAGCWEQREGDRWTEECWTSPRGGMMLGTNRSGRRAEVLEWEFLRIERQVPISDDRTVRLAYVASPGGRGGTLFAWSGPKGPGISFSNVANDYPQRIRYWREGRELIAEIALEDGSKAKRWRFRRKR